MIHEKPLRLYQGHANLMRWCKIVQTTKPHLLDGLSLSIDELLVSAENGFGLAGFFHRELTQFEPLPSRLCGDMGLIDMELLSVIRRWRHWDHFLIPRDIPTNWIIEEYGPQVSSI